jgi:hypothetical protein
MSKYLRVSDDGLGPARHNVGWLSSTGYVLLRDDAGGDPYLKAVADWLRAYGEPGPSGVGQLLVPELSAWMLGNDLWDQGLVQLSRITRRFSAWTADSENTHFLAVRDHLEYGVSVHRSPWIE